MPVPDPACRATGGRLTLTGSTVERGVVLLEPDEHGVLQAVEEQATLALARCHRCRTRVRVLPCNVLPRKRYSLDLIEHEVRQYARGDQSLDEAQCRAAWQERFASKSRATLYRWLKSYREKGYLGLLPKARSDRNGARHPSTAAWVGYAIGLLYEQADRSLYQLQVYLRTEFPGFSLSKTTLLRHLKAHPAYSGVEKLRSGKKNKLRSLFEADHPHEGWQLDGKGPFTVRLVDGTRVQVHVLTVLDDHSRAGLAGVVANSENTEAAIDVVCKAIAKWGIPDRFQFDRGSAFDSHALRDGLAAIGVHRNHVAAKSPEWQGKIEAYHRALGRWFVKELKAQEVVDFDHLQQLLEAMLELVYNRHHHNQIGTTPEHKLANRTSERRVSEADLDRAFFVTTSAKSHPKTGEVHLSNGSFRVPSAAFAGQRNRFRHHPCKPGLAVLVTRDGREIDLQPFAKKPLSDVSTHVERRGTGQLQKLVDLWQGKERPNAQPGFGLPEVFVELGRLLGRSVPNSEQQAHSVLAFYRKHGPLPRDDFLAACSATKTSLGNGRPLASYLADLERQIGAGRGGEPPSPDPED
jgi:transposase InsO family protein